jgi:hypothetical protein
LCIPFCLNGHVAAGVLMTTRKKSAGQREPIEILEKVLANVRPSFMMMMMICMRLTGTHKKTRSVFLFGGKRQDTVESSAL